MNKEADRSREILIAEAVREACIKVAKESFQEALFSGLCSDGAAEMALGALKSLDIGQIIQDTEKPDKTG